MGELTRLYDWSTTTLGTPDGWPQSLRTALSILLNSRFPMFLFWGDDLLCFYNDAYRPSLGNEGKHPEALGKKGEAVWPEIWPVIKPLIDQVLSGGDATWSEDQLIPIYRNGKLEDVYWTFSYSPVSDESGKPAGVFVTCVETTDKVMNLQSLGKSEQNLRNTILQAPVAMCIFKGPDYVVEIANERMFQFWGKEAEAVLGKPIFEGLPEVKGQGFEELLNSVYTTGVTVKAYAVPVTLPREGRIQNVYVDFVYEAYHEADGSISGVMAVAVDVTDNVLSRTLLEKTNSQLELLSDTVPAMIFYLDREERYQSYNKRFEEWFGVGHNEVIGKTVLEFIGQTAYQTVSQYLRNAYGGEQQRYEMKAPSRMGEQRWLNIVYTPSKAGDGNVNGLIVHASDVTAAKQIELALRESEARFRTLVEQAPVPIGMTRGREMVFEAINAPMLDLIGKTKDVLGKRLLDILPELKGQQVMDILYDVWDNKKSYKGYELPTMMPVNGKLLKRYYDTSYAPVFENGNVVSIIHLSVDVTEQVEVRQKLEVSEARFRTLADKLPQLVWMDDAERHPEYTSSSWAAYSGFSDRLAAWNYMAHPDDLQPIMQGWEEHFSNQLSFRYEVRLRGKDGVYRWHYSIAEPVKDATGKVVKWVGTLTDIHQQKTFAEALEQEVVQRTRELAQANKELHQSNEDLQQFAHVASHDLKEPVRKIRTFGSRLKSEFAADLPERAIFYLEKMESAATRMYSMIDGVLLYSSLGASKEATEAVDLNTILKQIQDDLEVVVQQKGAAITCEALPVVEGSSVLLYQLFYNLLNNSLKFTKAGETSRIQVTSEAVMPETPSNGKQQFAVIKIADNGIGFDQDQAENIFDTFVRLNSKDKFEGTGLGLALCQKIAERHGGTITAEGKEGAGATFTVLLPLHTTSMN